MQGLSSGYFSSPCTTHLCPRQCAPLGTRRPSSSSERLITWGLVSPGLSGHQRPREQITTVYIADPPNVGDCTYNCGGAPISAAEAAALFPILNLEWGDDTYSKGLSKLIHDFVTSRADISGDVLTAWAEELPRLSDEGRYFFSSSRYIFRASKPN